MLFKPESRLTFTYKSFLFHILLNVNICKRFSHFSFLLYIRKLILRANQALLKKDIHLFGQLLSKKVLRYKHKPIVYNYKYLVYSFFKPSLFCSLMHSNLSFYGFFLYSIHFLTSFSTFHKYSAL